MTKLISGTDGTERDTAEVYCSSVGIGDYIAEDEKTALNWIKKCVSYFPNDWKSFSPTVPPETIRAPKQDYQSVFSTTSSLAFNTRKVIDELVDQDSFFEMKAHFAREVVTGFGRVNGRVVGLVAHNSKFRFGFVSCESCRKTVWGLRADLQLKLVLESSKG